MATRRTLNSGKETTPSAAPTVDWPTIRQQLRAFVEHYQHANYERGQAQAYWNALFRCYNVGEPTLAKAFEHRLKLNKKNNYIDAFIPGKLIVEHKGSHVDLSSAIEQLQGYYSLLPPSEQPRYAVLCNFQKIRLYDFSNLLKPVITECAIHELPEKAELFKFLLPDETETGFLEQPSVDVKASQAIAELHKVLDGDGYQGRDLEVFLTRLIFCFFGDDTGIFGENAQLHRLLAATQPDGSDLGTVLGKLFEVLNTPAHSRSKNLRPQLAAFAYINGQLFADQHRMPDFNAQQREVILACSSLNWGSISPAIFGSMFQAVLEAGREQGTKRTEARRELGAHYTSERHILRAIEPLFLTQLRDDLHRAGQNKTALKDLHQRLANLHLLDPACGCGNFLVVAFQQLRLLEIEIAYRLHGDAAKSRGLLHMSDVLRVRVHQFYGIEIDPSAAHIARVALWITDHQMNVVAAQRLGQTRPSVPLIDSATIVQGNALTTDWASVLPPTQCSYIVGNPPFVGKSSQKPAQGAELAAVCATMPNMNNAGVLDYVAGWYIKATQYIQAAPAVRVAFVSTNSITQGEQVAVLWQPLLAQGVRIHFAHRTFKWSNDATGVAAVHCVIVGFGLGDVNQKTLFNYSDDIKGEPLEVAANNINPYLVDAPNLLIDKRRKPLCADAPEIAFGNMPNDGGNLLLSQAEADEIRARDAIAAKYIRRFLGADEFINNLPRYCLWLKDSTAADRKASPEIQRRMEAVKAMREASNRAATQKLAATPYLFGEIRQTSKRYLLIPSVSSEKRDFVPIGYLDAKIICSNANMMLPDASLYDFGILCSTMHNAWMRAVCGRLESRYRYSNTIVYNNFAWPQNPSAKQHQAIETAAQAILDARAAEEQRCADAEQPCSLATLYAPGNMPADLLKAHQRLDKAVDAAYGYKSGKDDASRVAFLFQRYNTLTSPLPLATEPPEGIKTKPARKPRKPAA